MPTRKRKRRRLNPAPILILAILFVLVSGLLYSPLTSLSRATVVGADAGDQVAIQQVLGALNGIPWYRVRPREIESSVQQIESVDHASYSQNIFGRGRLVVAYRVPVARVRSSRALGLDATGVIFQAGTLPTDLPLVVRPDDARDMPAAVGSGFPSAFVADLAIKARRLAPQAKLTIWFNSQGALCLNIGSGVVVLGACDDLDAKLGALKDILDLQPALLSQLESLNLTEPSHPARTYRKSKE